MKLKTLLAAILLMLPPAIAGAADITGMPKIRDGDQVQIGNSRIRLGGIDAPSIDQLCLNNSGERWTCGVAARDELIKHVESKTWTCHVRQTDRRGRMVARCEVDGEDIQKWLVTNGWALSYARFSHDYDADEKAAREAKAGMWQGAFIAPWDWRVRNKKTDDPRRRQAAGKCLDDPAGLGVRIGRALARLHHQGQRQPLRRMHLPSADQPLVREDRDEDQQGHALVLLGRRSRSRRLPRDPAIAAFCLYALPQAGERAQRARDALQSSHQMPASTHERPLRRSADAAAAGAFAAGALPADLARRRAGVHALAYLVLPLFWTHYEHQKGLANLPMVTRTAQGIPGDPINVGLIGDQKDVVCAMHEAGWYPADPITLKSSIEIVGSVLLDRPYKDAPVSNLYYLGRREDLAFEKPIGSKRRPPQPCPVLEGAGSGRGKAPGLARRRDLRSRRRRQQIYRRGHPSYQPPTSTPSARCSRPIWKMPGWSTPNIRSPASARR